MNGSQKASGALTPAVWGLLIDGIVSQQRAFTMQAGCVNASTEVWAAINLDILPEREISLNCIGDFTVMECL